MTVCRFYQQGYCRYGTNCKFEHPPKGGQQFGNRFGALAGQGNQNMGGRAADSPPYPGLTPETIQKDLSSEVPQWILSCYGPGRDAPEQLWGGYPREQSFEEIRLHFMMGAMAGNPQGALNDIQALYQNAQQQIQHTLNNIPAAIQFIVDGANKHPNRIDICKGQTGVAAPGGGLSSTANAFQKPATNAFGAPAAPATTVGAFGQPATLGQKPNPFGASAPAFGQPAQQSAFGQPSGLGGGSAFGQPAQTGGAFGQPSTLGAKPNPFGAPAKPATAAAFGQSSFGQPAALGQRPNPFGAPATTTSGGFGGTQPASNPFGQPTQQAPTNPSPFGQPATSQPANNPFGQPAAASANPFGQPQQQQQQQQQPAANPFGTPPTKTTPGNPFGQPATSSPFGQPAANSAFGQPATASPFGQPAVTAPANAFGAPQTSTALGASSGTSAKIGQGPYGPNATRQHPHISSYSSKDPEGKKLTMFKGRPVTYEEPKGGGKEVPVIRNFDGSKVRIWMPNGAPPYTDQTEAEPGKYEDPGVVKQWKSFVETGRFEGGVMPEVPPKREWCAWDF
ncbi:hypothetical protein VTI74DRAFT_6923 [Chaetomium olivicolor]